MMNVIVVLMVFSVYELPVQRRRTTCDVRPYRERFAQKSTQCKFIKVTNAFRPPPFARNLGTLGFIGFT